MIARPTIAATPSSDASRCFVCGERLERRDCFFCPFHYVHVPLPLLKRALQLNGWRLAGLNGVTDEQVSEALRACVAAMRANEPADYSLSREDGSTHVAQ